jgi:UDP-2-acetamido-2-deoxy-ribo-hexuluronate aminotransferase
MDVLLDVNIVVDICQPRPEFIVDALKVLSRCRAEGSRIWLYAGSVQTLEYSLLRGLMADAAAGDRSMSVSQAHHRARLLLRAFCEGKHWLAALAGEGDVFDAADPEDEQFLRALDRFKPGEIALITRDEALLARNDSRVLSPQQYCNRKTVDRSVDFIDLKSQQDLIRPQLETGIHRVLHHGQYIMGPEIKALESQLTEYVGVEHCITCASGTDALLMALMALDIGPGDEVITVPYTWISTAEVISLLHAKPVFVDVQPDTFNLDPTKLEAAITPATRAIMPVGIYGQCADMTAINAIAAKHGIPVIEDAAQCFGATHHGAKACNLSLIGCTSFFPSKPLGCYGDGGAIFTPDGALAEKMRQIRVHGQKVKHQHPLVGINGRLDTMQAAILLDKFEIFEAECRLRWEAGKRYDALLSNIPDIRPPVIAQGNTSVYAQYTILSPKRDALSQQLKAKGVPSVAYYTAPLHLQGAFSDLGHKAGDFPVSEKVAAESLSLPMSPYLSVGEQEKIVQAMGEGR